jgi:hypothetical protein
MVSELTNLELVAVRVRARKTARREVASIDYVMIEQAEGFH